jgi:ParB family chromosome partitioning protein
MAKKKALTRGLDAIFNDGATGTDLQSAIDAIEKKPDDFEQERVDIASIRPNPYQPRNPLQHPTPPTQNLNFCNVP